MPWGYAAAAAIAVGGSIVAANKQAGGQQAAAQTQAQMFNTLQGEQQPFITQGQNADTQLSELLNPANAGAVQNYIENLPGYQFQLQTGGQALTNSMTPGSGALSGATLKSLMSFNQGLAGTYYNNYVNQLMQQAQLGEAGTAALGGVGEGLGTGVAQAQAGAAASQAGGIVGGANSASTLATIMAMNNNNSNNYNWGGTPSSTGFTGAPYADASGSYSDRRLKEDIKRVGITDGGLPVYTFRFKGEKRTYMGVMADEVLNKIPEAVSKDDNGFYRVNYAMLE